MPHVSLTEPFIPLRLKAVLRIQHSQLKVFNGFKRRFITVLLCEKTAVAVRSHSEDLEYASAQVLTRTQPSFHISFFFFFAFMQQSLSI